MIRLFASHPTAANLLMVAIAVLGIAAVPTLQRDTFPLIPPTEVEVRVKYPGASPLEVEEGVCRRVEKPLRGVEMLVQLSCDARDNLAIITAEMREGADMRTFFDDVRAEIDGISTFPPKVEKPTSRIVERTATVSSVAVTGLEDPLQLFAYADTLADRLRRDPMIAKATLSGFSDREIEIGVSAAALRRHNLTLSAITDALERNSFDLPAGTMETRDGDAFIRFVGERRTPEAIAAIPVTGSLLGAEINIGELATVRTRFSDDSLAATFNGKRAALIEIAKTDDQDALKVNAVLLKRLEEERARAPDGVELTISGDSTSNIRDRLRIITTNGIQGLILVFVSMWLFFGLRFSFWVAMGLPVSFLGTVFAMQLMGLTINMITMVALLVAIGLLMDDAIVISENIMAKRQKGRSALDAAIEGTQQVLPGVVSSFLTTAMIVGPLALMAGKMGAVLKYMPLVLLITLAVSLLEAFLILPNHLRHALRAPRPSRLSRWVNSGFESFRDRVIVPVAGLALRARYLTIGIAGFLILASVAPFAGGFLKFQAFPTLDSDTVEARLILTPGTPPWRTKERVAKIVAALEALNEELTPLQPGGQPLLANILVNYGVNTDAAESGAHIATVSADLLRAEARNSTITEILGKWKALTGPMPDVAALRFTDRERGVAGKALEVRLSGNDLDELKAAAVKLRQFFASFAGVRDVSDDLRPGKPDYVVTLRPAAASALGVSARAVADQLRLALRGDTSLEIQDGHGAVDIIARFALPDRASLDAIRDLTVTGTEGALVPLSAIADIAESRGYTRIHRIDAVRTVTVEGTINPRVANAREILTQMKAKVLPEIQRTWPDLTVAIAGESKETSTTGGSLQKSLIIGILGVYLILAFQFRSYVEPISVLFAIPLAIVGVVWGHLALGMQLSMPSLVGLATLAGVVVNDSILLVSFIKARLAEGQEIVEAARDAVRDRFRPIFLTSLTTVVGLTPLLAETSTQAQFLRPLVASLAFGLTGATFLALFVTPAVFVVLHDLGWHGRATGQPSPDRQAASDPEKA